MYTGYTELVAGYTTIKVSIETKRMLDKLRRLLEERIGQRLDYDRVVAIAAREAFERLGVRRPQLLLRLFEEPLSGYKEGLGAKLLEEERLAEEDSG